MSDAAPFGYTDLTAQTLVAEPNSTYLCKTKDLPIATPMDSSVVGLMMLFSTIQYQAPYMDPKYTVAAQQAGHAAYIEAGGQGTQDKVVSTTTKGGTDLAHSAGITDLEMGILGGGYKTYRTRKIDVKGPKIWDISTHLTFTETSGTIGLKYEW